jgi:hypothetical protein
MTKLREMAKEVPACMGCGLENPNGDLLCLAHSNALEDGRGAYHKSDDLFGAFLCARCHDEVDGRAGMWGKEGKREFHRRAWIKTVRWLILNNRLKVM